MMSDSLAVTGGIFIPFIGTTVGAAMVFLMRGEMKNGIKTALSGFAAGVMLSAGVWSLLLPAIDMAEAAGTVSWLPAAAGFLLGVGFLSVLDNLIPHLHANARLPGASITGKSAMMVLAITLHNLPEGMAVGVILAALVSHVPGVTAASALAAAAGIALQNLPEGAVISMPLAGQGMSRGRAFAIGAASGVVEPVGAAVTLLLTAVMTPALPWILSFAAGAMVYVVLEELAPEFHEGGISDAGTISAAVGFAVMMVMDVALS